MAKPHITFHESQPARAQGLLAWLHIDLPLVIALLLLVGIGLAILFSAGDKEMALLHKQLIRLGFGFVVMVVLAQIHPDNFRRWSPWLYGLGILFLVLVILFGELGKGAQRWLDLGFVRFPAIRDVQVDPADADRLVSGGTATSPLPLKIDRSRTVHRAAGNIDCQTT